MPTMLIFMDESGDTGFKFSNNSSEFFTLAAVVFDNFLEADRCDRAIEHLRHTSHRKREYRFANCEHERRLEFFECVRTFRFQIAAVVVDKVKLRHPQFRNKETLIKCAVRYVFSFLPELADATLVIDRSGSRDFRLALDRYLKNQLNREGHKTIKKTRSQRSHTNNLLQLADMVCGAISRSYSRSRENPTVYRDLLVEKIRVVQRWPRQ